VKNDVITYNFAMQELHELRTENTWKWIKGYKTTCKNQTTNGCDRAPTKVVRRRMDLHV
jgi:hypothetical protein